VAVRVATVSLVPGNANEVASVPVNVSELLAVNVFPSAMVSVDDVAGAVMATLFTLVADAAPNVGVTNVGDVVNATVLLPDSSVNAAAKFALLGVAKKAATLEPNPETPVDIGSPVQLVNVPELGVPSAGVVNVGLVNVLLVRVCVPVNVTSVSVPEGTVNVEVPEVVNVKVCAADIVRVAPETPTLVML